MIDKIDANQPLIESGTSSKGSNSAKAVPNNDEDVSLEVNYASLINKAIQAQHTDTKTIQQARELLLSGQLESPENIQAAAENIIKFGI